ncbi:Oye2p [Sugiyamaella lignohabitans]|uniref:Oye2p n=1 Tax=Sugiyamaella lignohabitans TaxID=796027 RepID=A0A167DHV9_9ASCO|nr:Oye2p [Sugiyamaella lignohabitans]ANB12936.1 Oye2p [Sugiyamaella lignohabitans]
MTVSSSTPPLFSPIKVGKSTLQHRIALAPLTRFRSPKHVPGDLVAEYYEQRASRPGTLLITEATFIAAKAGGIPNVPGIWSQEQIDAWKKVTDRVHAKKSFIYAQIWALGRQAFPAVLKAEGFDYVSASDVPIDEERGAPRPLTKEEIKEYIQLYVKAAKNAVEAGFDGIELHSANGYLLDQFLHENTNQRTDEYGGSIENRARFTLEVVDALVEAIGADRVGIRLSPWNTYGEVFPGISPIPQWSYVVAELEKRAVEQNKRLAFVHIVEPRIAGHVNLESWSGSNEFINNIWKGILIKAGNMLPVAAEVAEKEPNTIIAVGRHFISNPDIVDKLERKLELTDYDRDTFYTNDAKGYTDYPFAK